MVESEDGDAGGDECDHEIFVEREVFAENGQVQEHDRKELTGLGEDEGDVVDVSEGGIAEGRGKRGSDGDENQGEDDGAGGEDRGGAAGSRGGFEEVDVAGQSSQGGLDRVEEDRVGEFFRRRWRTVGGCCDAFLQKRPGETGAERR